MGYPFANSKSDPLDTEEYREFCGLNAVDGDLVTMSFGTYTNYLKSFDEPVYLDVEDVKMEEGKKIEPVYSFAIPL
ncbi:MAG: hypothetical protein JSS95_11905 [Acidobacteria bacterium]|nr:hypothetical protein [Acidobacteriota bacterium]